MAWQGVRSQNPSGVLRGSQGYLDSVFLADWAQRWAQRIIHLWEFHVASTVPLVGMKWNLVLLDDLVACSSNFQLPSKFKEIEAETPCGNGVFWCTCLANGKVNSKFKGFKENKLLLNNPEVHSMSRDWKNLEWYWVILRDDKFVGPKTQHKNSYFQAIETQKHRSSRNARSEKTNGQS